MKKIFLLLPFIILFSCTLQKRKYQKGFYVSWKHKTEKEARLPADGTARAKVAPQAAVAMSLAPAAGEAALATAQQQKTAGIVKRKTISLFTKDEPCDELLFKDGTEQKIKLIENGVSEIRYRKCDTPDGPDYVVRKSELFMIKYANGTREVFKNEPNVSEKSRVKMLALSGNQQTHTFAILSFIFGLLGLIPFAYTLIIFSIMAIVFGRVALRIIKENPELYKGETLARVGFILGIVELCVLFIAIIIVIALILALI